MERLKSAFDTVFRRNQMPETAPRVPDGQRIYAVGDIHGRLDLLDSLLAMIVADHRGQHDHATGEIILLGDLIDRGPQSRVVIERAMHWAEPDMALSVIKGNHELCLIGVLDGDTQWLQSWLRYGGHECLQSYGVPTELLLSGQDHAIAESARARVPEAHQHWLRALPLMLRRGDYCFVHAGVRPGVPLDDQIADDLAWIREPFLGDRRDHGAMIVHGHTIVDAIDERPNRIGLDTGAYRTNNLSAVRLIGADRRYFGTAADTAG